MIYVVQMGPDGPVKIGYSKKPYSRIRSMRTAWPYEPIVLAIIKGDKDREREIHAKLRQYRLRGEWFQPAAEVLAMAGSCEDFERGYERESRYLSHRQRRERRLEMAERIRAGEHPSEVAKSFGVCVQTAKKLV